MLRSKNTQSLLPALFQRFRKGPRTGKARTGNAHPGRPSNILNLLPMDEPMSRAPGNNSAPWWPHPGIPRYLWKYRAKPRLILFAKSPDAVAELDLLVTPNTVIRGGRHFKISAAASILLHGFLVALLLMAASSNRVARTTQLMLRFNHPTTLVAPPPELVRRLTGGGPAKALSLAQLETRARVASPARPSLPPGTPAPFVPPASSGPHPAHPSIAPPKLSPGRSAVGEPPAAIVAAEQNIPAPPPQIQPEEKQPKLAFEKPGPATYSKSLSSSDVGAVGSKTRSPMRKPGSSVQAAIREVARSGGGGQGLVIGDLESTGGVLEAHTVPPSRGNTGSNLKLLSAPMGIDFRPYLIQVLSAVRRNWRAVIPQSAKLGRRGTVVIQFAIDRSGQVPKLVIAVPSGSNALDRAAVAGVSASNPFPPLPAKFPGNEIRLQLNFLYNIKRK